MRFPWVNKQGKRIIKVPPTSLLRSLARNVSAIHPAQTHSSIRMFRHKVSPLTH